MTSERQGCQSGDVYMHVHAETKESTRLPLRVHCCNAAFSLLKTHLAGRLLNTVRQCIYLCILPLTRLSLGSRKNSASHEQASS